MSGIANSLASDSFSTMSPKNQSTLNSPTSSTSSSKPLLNLKATATILKHARKLNDFHGSNDSTINENESNTAKPKDPIPPPECLARVLAKIAKNNNTTLPKHVDSDYARKKLNNDLSNSLFLSTIDTEEINASLHHVDEDIEKLTIVNGEQLNTFDHIEINTRQSYDFENNRIVYKSKGIIHPNNNNNKHLHTNSKHNNDASVPPMLKRQGTVVMRQQSIRGLTPDGINKGKPGGLKRMNTQSFGFDTGLQLDDLTGSNTTNNSSANTKGNKPGEEKDQGLSHRHISSLEQNYRKQGLHRTNTSLTKSELVLAMEQDDSMDENHMNNPYALSQQQATSPNDYFKRFRSPAQQITLHMLANQSRQQRHHQQAIRSSIIDPDQQYKVSQAQRNHHKRRLSTLLMQHAVKEYEHQQNILAKEWQLQQITNAEDTEQAILFEEIQEEQSKSIEESDSEANPHHHHKSLLKTLPKSDGSFIYNIEGKRIAIDQDTSLHYFGEVSRIYFFSHYRTMLKNLQQIAPVSSSSMTGGASSYQTITTREPSQGVDNEDEEQEDYDGNNSYLGQTTLNSNTLYQDSMDDAQTISEEQRLYEEEAKEIVSRYTQHCTYPSGYLPQQIDQEFEKCQGDNASVASITSSLPPHLIFATSPTIKPSKRREKMMQLSASLPILPSISSSNNEDHHELEEISSAHLQSLSTSGVLTQDFFQDLESWTSNVPQQAMIDKDILTDRHSSQFLHHSSLLHRQKKQQLQHSSQKKRKNAGKQALQGRYALPNKKKQNSENLSVASRISSSTPTNSQNKSKYYGIKTDLTLNTSVSSTSKKPNRHAMLLSPISQSTGKGNKESNGSIPHRNSSKPYIENSWDILSNRAGDISPRTHYLAGCIREGIQPLPNIILRREYTTVLNISHYNIGDKMGCILAECLTYLPQIESLNLADNNLTDISLYPLINSISQIKTLKELNLSQNKIDGESSEALANYVSRQDCPLITLTLQNADIDDDECISFVQCLLSNEQLLELDMSYNLLGSSESQQKDIGEQEKGKDREGFIQWLNKKSSQQQQQSLQMNVEECSTGGEIIAQFIQSSSCRLRKLTLAWNNIRSLSANELMYSLRYNHTLTYLDLNNNGLGYEAGEILGDALMENRTLKTLLVNNNNFTSTSCISICIGVIENLALQYIEMNENPIGIIGAKFMMQISMQVGTRVQIEAKNCNTIQLDERCWYDPNLPCRDYVLQLSKPFHRAIAFHLMHLVASHSTFIIQSCKYDAGVNGKKTENIKLIQSYAKDRELYLDKDTKEIIAGLRKLSEAASNIELGKQLFYEADADGSGRLDKEELTDVLNKIGFIIDSDRLQDIINLFDIDGAGSIDMSEFLLLLKSQQRETNMRIKELIEYPIMALASNPHVKYIPPRSGTLMLTILDGFVQKSRFHMLSSLDQKHAYNMAKGIGDVRLMTDAVQHTKLRYYESLQLYKTLYKEIPDKISVLLKILPLMTHPSEARQLVHKITNGNRIEYQRIKLTFGIALKPLFGQYNGYYQLDLSKEIHRICLARLLEQSQTFNHNRLMTKAISSNGLFGDLSQHGNWTCFRNEIMNGQKIILSTKMFTPMPNQGIIEFDFSGSNRPNGNELKLSDKRLGKVLINLALIQNKQEFKQAMHYLQHQQKCLNKKSKNGTYYLGAYAFSVDKAINVGKQMDIFYDNILIRTQSLKMAAKKEEIRVNVTGNDAQTIQEFAEKQQSKQSSTGNNTSNNTSNNNNNGNVRRSARSAVIPMNGGLGLSEEEGTTDTKDTNNNNNNNNNEEIVEEGGDINIENDEQTSEPNDINELEEEGQITPESEQFNEELTIDTTIEGDGTVNTGLNTFSSIGNSEFDFATSTMDTNELLTEDPLINENNSESNSLGVLEAMVKKPQSTDTDSDDEEDSDEDKENEDGNVFSTDQRKQQILDLKKRLYTLYHTPKGLVNQHAKAIRFVEAIDETFNQLWLYSRHVALILKLFIQLFGSNMIRHKYFSTYLTEIVICLFARIIDLHNFEIIYELMNPQDIGIFYCRIGLLNCFNPMKPDITLELSLNRREERLMAKMIVYLSVIEPGLNLTFKSFQWKRELDPIPGWDVTEPWMTEAGLSTHGKFAFTYYSGEGMNKYGCIADLFLRKALTQFVLINENEIIDENEMLPEDFINTAIDHFEQNRDIWVNYLGSNPSYDKLEK